MRLIAKQTSDFFENSSLPNDTLSGIVISTPGIIEYKTNSLKFNSLNPVGGNDIQLASVFRPFFPDNIPILVENVGKLASRVYLNGKIDSDWRVLVLFTAWGTSGCFIDKGHIMNGRNSLIGEIGHMIIDASSDIECGCGCNGCFEQRVGIKMVRNYCRELLPDYPDSMLSSCNIDTICIEDIFKFSEQEDSLSRIVVEKLAYYFALMLHNITISFDPTLVIFQGIFSHADNHFKEELEINMKKFLYYRNKMPFFLDYDTEDVFTLNIKGATTLLLDYLL